MANSFAALLPDLDMYALASLVPILIVGAAIAIDWILAKEPAAAERKLEQARSLANPGR